MFQSYLDKFSSVLSKTVITDNKGESLGIDAGFDAIWDRFESLKQSNRVYLVGNGGSSGIVSHSAVDFLNACGYKGVALTDNSMLTCMANDYGYEQVFSQPLKTLFEPGDALVAISSSGSSRNIVNAAELAAERDGFVVTLSGFKTDNALRSCGDFNLWLDINDYGVVEIGHALLMHHLTDRLMALNR